MLIKADARFIPLKDETVQCCVTSPPYWGLRDYGISGQLGLETTPEEYVANMVAVFREIKRVLRKDGTLWLNLGDSYYSGDRGGWRGDGHRWEKSELQKANRGNATTIRPNRLPQRGLKDKDLIGIPWRVALALQADGWYLRSDIIWSKPNPMPESVTDRPTKAHEYIFLMSKSGKYYYNAESVREPHKYPDDTNRPRGRELGEGEFKVARYSYEERILNPLGRNKRTVWEIATQPYSGAHFATFPEEIPRLCILAGSRPGDYVLDPFGGSGTTGKVALENGRKPIHLDLAYFDLARKRMSVTPAMEWLL